MGTEDGGTMAQLEGAVALGLMGRGTGNAHHPIEQPESAELPVQAGGQQSTEGQLQWLEQTDPTFKGLRLHRRKGRKAPEAGELIRRCQCGC